MKRHEVVLLVACVLANPGGAFAKEAKDPLNIKEGALDEIHLKVPTVTAGVPVVIRPFSTEGVDLGTGGDDAKNEKRSDATKAMVKIGPDILGDSMKAALVISGKFKDVQTGPDATPAEGALVVEGKFLRIDPGSRAKRYWASFGAGKSGIEVAGTVKDSTGKLLAEFTHGRSSGIGIGGGDYLKFLSDDTRDVGRDLASFLAKWASGEDLHKD